MDDSPGVPDYQSRPLLHPWRVAGIWVLLLAGLFWLFRVMEPAPPVAPTVSLSRTPGIRLFYHYECGKCHTLHFVPGAEGKLAPLLDHIGTVGATRVSGLNAAQYIRQSIVEPQAFVVEGYLNAMPSFRRMPPKELAELTDYLSQLR